MWFSLVISVASIGVGIVSIVRTEREIRRLKLRERLEAELSGSRQRLAIAGEVLPLAHQYRLWSAAQEQLADRLYMEALARVANKEKTDLN